MLISFSVENWMSFRERTTLSMVASRERQHGDRIARISKYPLKVLPVAAVYGGNASGKTNLFKALSFAKRLVVEGSMPGKLIPVDLFLLDPKMARQPARFFFELLVDDIVYEFSFAVTRSAVWEEKLTKVSTSSESVLYHRQGDNPNFDHGLENDQALLFAFKGTQDNQLFLTNSVFQKLQVFKQVYCWFKDSLTLVAPDARFKAFDHYIDEQHPLSKAMSIALPRLDMGIARLGGEKIPVESVQLPESLKAKLKEDVKDGAKGVVAGPHDQRYVVTRKGDELVYRKLVSWHRNVEDAEVRFELSQESDGSRRALDLLPAFLELAETNSRKVYVIDELDRCMHSMLTRGLLASYLSSCSASSRSQLLFTTHDLMQMDQRLFRRDELWLAERDAAGVSSLRSFGEYHDVRYDKDIRKSYLQGRMGGVPRLGGIGVGGES